MTVPLTFENHNMRTVLITGTSSGFGLLTSVEMARRGWHVFATMRNLEKRGRLEAALDEAGVRDNVDISRLDVMDQASIDEAVPAILERAGGRLDGVVQNAGVTAAGAFEDLSDADVRRVMETNFFGVLAVTRAVLPTFRAQHRGRIVIISSNSAFSGQPMNSVYCASKFALEGWAESLAFEVAPFDLNISLIEPGAYRTPIWEDVKFLKPDGSPYAKFVRKVETTATAHFERVARDPQEVANKVARALEAPKPKFRYQVGPEAIMGWLARGKITTGMMLRGTQRYLGIRNFKL